MKVCVLQWVVLALFAYGVGGIYGNGSGPKVKATKGAVWPQPQQRETTKYFFTIVPSNFEFSVTAETCHILYEAIERCKRILQNTLKLRKSSVRNPQQVKGQFISRWTSQQTFSGQLSGIEIVLKNPCFSSDLPTMNMDESYVVNIGDSPSIIGNTIWGVLRGLETFSQILYPSLRGEEFLVNVTRIVDFPRFSHRGLLIDTSSHFLPVISILQTLDAMGYNKMNVLHWHITDDPSFPYESVSYPDLSAKGAYHPSMVYSQKDVAAVIEYARLRGIRVMVEFNTPGSISSWGKAFPKLLAVCYSNDQPIGALGLIDPSKNSTYDFMENFLKEIINIFPDEYIHLGGDEMDFTCWKSNPFIATFMKENNINSYEKLEEYYVQKVLGVVDEMKASSVVWQEVYENGVILLKETVVHVWIENNYRKKLMSYITDDGYRVLLSAGWNLDVLGNEWLSGDWLKFYRNDAHDFLGTEEQKKLVIGGEACMWGDVVDATNVISRAWPRASAVAERLWSNVQVTDEDDAARRLEEHYCRMQVRGIKAQPPNGAGFCI